MTAIVSCPITRTDRPVWRYHWAVRRRGVVVGEGWALTRPGASVAVWRTRRRR